jgi:CpcD/allophycocyanin linker domain
MVGMTVASNTADLSEYTSRMVRLEVTGGKHQEGMRTSTYTIKVPCSRLSTTMQSINRMGGKITNVTALSSASVTPASAPAAVAPPAKAPNPPAKAVAKETAAQSNGGSGGFGQSKSKRKR